MKLKPYLISIGTWAAVLGNRLSHCLRPYWRPSKSYDSTVAIRHLAVNQGACAKMNPRELEHLAAETYSVEATGSARLDSTLAPGEVMAITLGNFKAWYVDVLATLYPIRNAGIAILMLSLPLLERYLRRKNQLAPSDKLNDDYFSDLGSMFPTLSRKQDARQFWNLYRNGFLHQVTLSRQNKGGAPLPVGWLSHDIGTSVKIETDGSFWVHPVLFSQEVVRTIEQNFTIFEGTGTAGPPLPIVVTHVSDPVSDPINVPSVYLGTRGGP